MAKIVSNIEPPCYGGSIFGNLGNIFISIFGNLGNSYKDCIDIDDFKKCLQNWAGPTCSCSYCILCILNLM